MEKQTLLAIVLSVAVMLGYFLLQPVLFPAPEPPPPVQTSQAPSEPVSSVPVTPPETSPTETVSAPEETQATESRETDSGKITEEVIPPQTVTIDTDLLTVKLSNEGGNVVSFRLKEHMDKGEPVEMIFAGNGPSQAFAVEFGNMENVMAKRTLPTEGNFRVKQDQGNPLIVEFSKDFQSPTGGFFTLVKRYEFKKGEYMFELSIELDGGNSVDSYNFDGAAYTLIFGPQIGPSFVKLDQRSEYRRYLSYNAKMKTEKVSEGKPVILNQPAWAAISGKYFALVAMPHPKEYTLAFSTQAGKEPPNTSQFFITRHAATGSRFNDTYHFYLGPKNQENLNIYEHGDNKFGLRDTGLIEIAATKGFLAPLEKALKWLLVMFNRLIPNYGIAIILVTLVVKLVMFPLTKKGSESTLRMQALSPKIKEIQAKYKDNPQKMNAEMAEFYKKEGYNPLSGCLPMIIQIPIFFAMYNLFNNHFDLRGAMFIPGWIPDLSVPEAIYNFPNNFRLPLLGWTAIRLLPFIYVGSQLLYGMVTQTPDQKGNSQMKIMLYVMPIAFFFILYDVPSGLLIYWIMSNLLTLVQQVIINRYIKGKRAVAVVEEPKPVIAPGGSKKGGKKKRRN